MAERIEIEHRFSRTGEIKMFFLSVPGGNNPASELSPDFPSRSSFRVMSEGNDAINDGANGAARK